MEKQTHETKSLLRRLESKLEDDGIVGNLVLSNELDLFPLLLVEEDRFDGLDFGCWVGGKEGGRWDDEGSDVEGSELKFSLRGVDGHAKERERREETRRSASRRGERGRRREGEQAFQTRRNMEEENSQVFRRVLSSHESDRLGSSGMIFEESRAVVH